MLQRSKPLNTKIIAQIYDKNYDIDSASSQIEMLESNVATNAPKSIIASTLRLECIETKTRLLLGLFRANKIPWREFIKLVEIAALESKGGAQ